MHRAERLLRRRQACDEAGSLEAGEQRGADNLGRNPQGLVPTLEIDDLRLTQSLAILEFLEELQPEPPLLPPDLYGPTRPNSLGLDLTVVAHREPLLAAHAALVVPTVPEATGAAAQAESDLLQHVERLLDPQKEMDIDAIRQALGSICDLYSPGECWNYLKEAGYVAD